MARAWSANSRCSRRARAIEYTSGVPLPTASGFMTGSYQMVTEAGERFDIDVPTFSLDSPSPDGEAGVELTRFRARRYCSTPASCGVNS